MKWIELRQVRGVSMEKNTQKTGTELVNWYYLFILVLFVYAKTSTGLL